MWSNSRCLRLRNDYDLRSWSWRTKTYPTIHHLLQDSELEAGQKRQWKKLQLQREWTESEQAWFLKLPTRRVTKGWRKERVKPRKRNPRRFEVDVVWSAARCVRSLAAWSLLKQDLNAKYIKIWLVNHINLELHLEGEPFSKRSDRFPDQTPLRLCTVWILGTT